jgi:hypothetical protein
VSRRLSAHTPWEEALQITIVLYGHARTHTAACRRCKNILEIQPVTSGAAEIRIRSLIIWNGTRNDSLFLIIVFRPRTTVDRYYEQQLLCTCRTDERFCDWKKLHRRAEIKQTLTELHITWASTEKTIISASARQQVVGVGPQEHLYRGPFVHNP